MLIIMDSKPLGETCMIDKNQTYSVYDTDKNTSKSVKGSTLLSNMSSDLKKGACVRYGNATSNKTFRVVDTNTIASNTGVLFRSDGSISNPNILSSTINKLDNNKAVVMLEFYGKFVMDLKIEKDLPYDGLVPVMLVIFGKKYSIMCKNGVFTLNFAKLTQNGNGLLFDMYIDYADERQRHILISHVEFSNGMAIYFGKPIRMITRSEFMTSALVGVTDKLLQNRKINCLAFKGDSYLSNYYPCKVRYDGRVYDSSEAVYQSLKTTSKEERDRFVGLTPDESKALGRSLKLRSDYNKVMQKIMYDAVYAKFTQHQELAEQLSSTGDAYLIEDTTGWHDNIWGNCNCPRCQSIQGKNYLGKVLMKLRKNLSSGVIKSKRVTSDLNNALSAFSYIAVKSASNDEMWRSEMENVANDCNFTIPSRFYEGGVLKKAPETEYRILRRVEKSGGSLIVYMLSWCDNIGLNTVRVYLNDDTMVSALKSLKQYLMKYSSDTSVRRYDKIPEFCRQIDSLLNTKH